MFKIYDSNVKITKVNKVTEKMVVGILYSTYKDSNNNFVKTFIPCKIVGVALTEFEKLGLKDRDKFNIIEGSLKNEPYTKDGKQIDKVVITVFSLKAFEEKPSDSF